MPSKTETVKFFLEFPPWANMKTATALFGIGEKTIKLWVEQGLILEHRKGRSSRQVRCKDINRVMTDFVEGRTPKKAIYVDKRRPMRRTVKS